MTGRSWRVPVGLQAWFSHLRQFNIPERPGSPMPPWEINAEIMTGERTMVGRRDPVFIQLHALRATHQRDQQAFTFIAQSVLKVTLQTQLEQPQASLGQGQAHNQQHTDQTKAEPRLNRPQTATPPKR